jgi:putative ABC transport system permease protein
MAWFGEQWRRLYLLLKREQLDSELDDEIALHRELRAEKLHRQGMPMDQATAQAHRRIGNALFLREQTRDAGGWPWLEALWQDLLWAVRMIRKNAGFAAFAIVSLAIGIGANTAIFSVLETLLLRPLAYPNAERLTVMTYTRAKEPDSQMRVSVSDLIQWRVDNQAFDQIEATSGSDMTALSGAGEPQRVGMVAVSPGYFSLLGVAPILGRLPSESDFGKGRTLALSYEFWQRHFGGDSHVLGQSVFVDNMNGTVVGILSPGFDLFGQGSADVYRLMPIRPGPPSGSQRWLYAIGRLKSGINVAMAQASMDLVARRLEEEYPKTNRELRIKVQPLQEGLFGSVRNLVYPLFATVAFVLLIACSNIANLLLSRSAGRSKEFAIRAALGAGRFRLIRQMLIESVVLSFAGGLLGLALSVWGVRLFVALAPRWLPQTKGVLVDARVLVFTLAISLLAGITFGLVPALRASRIKINDSLKDCGQVSPAGSRERTRNALVVLEVALSLSLLMSAGLMMNAFLRLIRLHPGFNPAQLLTMEIRLIGNRYFDLRPFPKTGFDLVTPQVGAYWKQLLQQLRKLPEVESAALIDWLPMSFGREGRGSGLQIVGRDVDSMAGRGGVLFSAISTDYFRVMQIPLIRGRHFSKQDEEADPWVAVVNDAAAHRFWPDQDPVGQVIVLDAQVAGQRPREIVGVVGNVRQFQLAQDQSRKSTLRIRSSRRVARLRKRRAGFT